MGPINGNTTLRELKKLNILPIRAINSLATWTKHNWEATLTDVQNVTAEDLLAYQNMGKKSLAAIAEFMKSIGMDLKSKKYCDYHNRIVWVQVPEDFHLYHKKILEENESIKSKLHLLAEAVIKSHYLTHSGLGKKEKMEKECLICDLAREIL